MNHDIAAGRYAKFFCPFLVIVVWVGNVERQVVATLSVAGINNIGSFRSLVVALLLLDAFGLPAQGYFVGPYLLSFRKQCLNRLACFSMRTLSAMTASAAKAESGRKRSMGSMYFMELIPFMTLLIFVEQAAQGGSVYAPLFATDRLRSFTAVPLNLE